jgi:hypothetical protein
VRGSTGGGVSGGGADDAIVVVVVVVGAAAPTDAVDGVGVETAAVDGDDVRATGTGGGGAARCDISGEPGVVVGVVGLVVGAPLAFAVDIGAAAAAGVVGGIGTRAAGVVGGAGAPRVGMAGAARATRRVANGPPPLGALVGDDGVARAGAA